MDYPTYGSTFTLFRLSPLYHGASHVFENLDLHARRLREHLAGDRARTLLLTDLQPEIAGTGNLETCNWNLIGDEATWGRGQDERNMVNASDARGIQIQLRFERAKYDAVMLGEPSSISTTPGFTCLPLLLLRMPVALRDLFLDFVSTTFDARHSSMKLRSSFLSLSLESLLLHTLSQDDEDPSLDLQSLSKGIGLQLSFPSAAPHLKSLDIVIAKDDIREFQSRGNELWKLYQTRSHRVSGWSSRPERNITGPFTAALAVYLSNHTALELDDPAIVLSKVAFGPFALGGEGKVKVLATSAAAVQFWEALVGEAQPSGLEVGTKTPAVTAADVPGQASRKQRMTSIPSEPPPPYELVDPAQRMQ